MSATAAPTHNITAVIPMLMVTSMERSLAFYMDGLGFKIENRWVQDGRLRWCRMSLGGAAQLPQPCRLTRRNAPLKNQSLNLSAG